MNKKVRIIFNISLALLLLVSVGWGLLVRTVSCTWEASCGVDESGYWPIVFLFLIPLLIIVAMIITNKKK